MPAIPNSGAISLTDFATEFGGTAPHSMSEYYRNGANVPSNNSNVPTAGAFRFGHMRGAINEIIIAATSGANVDISGLFGANWTSTVPKRLTVPAGVTIGGTGSSAALIIPSNMAGTLEIDNAGDIIGFGGAANGGGGGNAISNSASGVTINNTGLLAGGGGGGALGGAGGGGSYSSYQRQPSSGSYYSSGNYWRTGSETPFQILMFSTNIYTGSYGQANALSTFTTGGWTYIRGYYVTGESEYDIQWYTIAREQTVNVSTSGGSGGASGIGQGYNQTNTSGSNGSSGGTNAGSGGAGSNGATYGLSASNGSTGANGNASNGSAGASGGAAGAAVIGTSVTMNNSATLYGAVA